VRGKTQSANAGQARSAGATTRGATGQATPPIAGSSQRNPRARPGAYIQSIWSSHVGRVFERQKAARAAGRHAVRPPQGRRQP
jgi:hypothetical protein